MVYEKFLRLNMQLNEKPDANDESLLSKVLLLVTMLCREVNC